MLLVTPVVRSNKPSSLSNHFLCTSPPPSGHDDDCRRRRTVAGIPRSRWASLLVSPPPLPSLSLDCGLAYRTSRVVRLRPCGATVPWNPHYFLEGVTSTLHTSCMLVSLKGVRRKDAVRADTLSCIHQLARRVLTAPRHRALSLENSHKPGAVVHSRMPFLVGQGQPVLFPPVLGWCLYDPMLW